MKACCDAVASRFSAPIAAPPPERDAGFARAPGAPPERVLGYAPASVSTACDAARRDGIRLAVTPARATCRRARSPMRLPSSLSLTLAAAALPAAALAACVHTVPLTVGPDDGLVVGAGAPVATSAAAGAPVAVNPDWTLVIDRRAGSDRATLDGPLTLSHADGVLTVAKHGVGAYAPAPAETWSFADTDVRGVHLERPDTTGTAVVVTATTLLCVAGVIGLAQFARLGEQ